MLKEVLNNKPNLRKHLFEKGFLITNNYDVNEDGYPFYNNWIKSRIEEYDFWTYKSTNIYTYDSKYGVLFLWMYKLIDE